MKIQRNLFILVLVAPYTELGILILIAFYIVFLYKSRIPFSLKIFVKVTYCWGNHVFL